MKDRRIQKTKSLLHAAFASLIREKEYDSIVVKEILDRANVGRSTFYTHFRDKDALLASSIRDMLFVPSPTRLPSSAKWYEAIIGFSLPIFEHIHEHRQAGQVRIGARGRAILHEHLQEVLAELVAQGLRKDAHVRRKISSHIPLDLLVQYVASTFILVLNWWVERDPLPPKQINDMFRALVLPAFVATGR